MASRRDFNPRTPEKWAERLQYLDPEIDPSGVEVHDNQYPSASKLGEIDFLHLKVLWINESDVECRTFLPTCVDPEHWETALGHVAPRSVRQSGTEGFSPIDNSADARGSCIFENVSHLQSLVWQLDDRYTAGRETQKVGLLPADQTEAPRRSQRLAAAQLQLEQQMGQLSLQEPPKTPAQSRIRNQEGESAAAKAIAALGMLSPGGMAPVNSTTEDEEIVNMALIMFLITTAMTIPGVNRRVQWLPSRRQFFVGKRLCEARTDGYLKNRLGVDKFDNTLAILEVKAFTRGRRQAEIEWQEGAQMAAWISHTMKGETAEARTVGLLRSSKVNMKRYVSRF